MHDIGEEVKDIVARLEEFGEFMKNPKYKAEIQAIKAKENELLGKIKRNFKFDDEGLEMWKLHMDNDKAHEIEAERHEQGEDIEKFWKKHAAFRAKTEKMGREICDELEDIGERIQETCKFLSDPKYKAELEKIGRGVDATNKKIERNLKWDDEGYNQWTLSMDNGKFKEVAAEREASKAQMRAFFKNHKKVQAEFHDMFEEVGEELHEISESIERWDRSFANGCIKKDPKYYPEIQAIAKKIEATNNKVKQHLKFDDEGLKM